MGEGRLKAEGRKTALSLMTGVRGFSLFTFHYLRCVYPVEHLQIA